MKLSSIVKYFFPIVINREAHGLFLTVLIMLLLASQSLSGQEGNQRPSRDVARDAWERGNYETAYEQYNGLLLLYSRDPLYRYYTGACLVNLQRDIPRAIELLGSAINSSVKVKSVPDDMWFWYGRALQMNGDFAQATNAYDKFSKTAGRRIAQEYGVQTFIDQCEAGSGAIDLGHASIRQPAEAQSRQAGEQGARSTEQGAQSTEQGARSKGQGAVSGERRAESVEIKEKGRDNINADVPREYDALLAEAVKTQHEADSLALIAEGTRRDLEAAPEKDERQQQRTEEIEKQAAGRQEEADNLFMKLEGQKTPPPPLPAEKVQPQKAHVYSRFELRPTPSYSTGNPVPIDIKLPAGLVYTIQIAAFKNPLDPVLFKGLFPVFGKLKQETGITFYYTGLFRRIEDARQALPEARSAGFSDAFIIALMDDTRVSMERAAILENEWAGRPLPGEPGDEKDLKTVEPADTVAVGTLSFRAEVMRLDKPAKPELIEKLTLLAGTRGLDIIKNNNDETVFLIGNFITFDSADDYVSLLIRNGYSSARVVAYVGRHEIPVEAAKELIKRLPND
jgi:tetratricopeptide (TPR) repeat protein